MKKASLFRFARLIVGWIVLLAFAAAWLLLCALRSYTLTMASQVS